MNVVLPTPIKESKGTVTLSRSDWDALIESIEDAEDLAAVRARRAHEAAVGKDVARGDYLTGDEVQRLLDWDASMGKRHRNRLDSDLGSLTLYK